MLGDVVGSWKGERAGPETLAMKPGQQRAERQSGAGTLQAHSATSDYAAFTKGLIATSMASHQYLIHCCLDDLACTMPMQDNWFCLLNYSSVLFACLKQSIVVR